MTRRKRLEALKRALEDPQLNDQHKLVVAHLIAYGHLAPWELSEAMDLTLEDAAFLLRWLGAKGYAEKIN